MPYSEFEMNDENNIENNGTPPNEVGCSQYEDESSLSFEKQLEYYESGEVAGILVSCLRRLSQLDGVPKYLPGEISEDLITLSIRSFCESYDFSISLSQSERFLQPAEIDRMTIGGTLLRLLDSLQYDTGMILAALTYFLCVE